MEDGVRPGGGRGVSAGALRRGGRAGDRSGGAADGPDLCVHGPLGYGTLRGAVHLSGNAVERGAQWGSGVGVYAEPARQPAKAVAGLAADRGRGLRRETQMVSVPLDGAQSADTGRGDGADHRHGDSLYELDHVFTVSSGRRPGIGGGDRTGSCGHGGAVSVPERGLHWEIYPEQLGTFADHGHVRRLLLV